MMRQTIIISMVYLVLATSIPAQADSYQLTLNLDIDKGQLDGQMLLYYENSGPIQLKEIRLRLDENFHASASILSVCEANEAKLDWSYLPFKFAKNQSEKGQMSVILPKPLRSGDTMELRIHFRVDDKKLITKGMTVLQDDPFQSFDAWYPKAMTKKAGKWSFSDDRPSNYDVTIEVPVGYTIASTGRLVEERAAGNGRRILHLKAERVRGFTIYGSPRWKKHSRNSEGIELNIYLPDEAKDWAKPMLDVTADVIRFLRKEYGEFPTQHLPAGDSPGFPGQVPAGHLHSTDTTGLAGVITELFDFTEYLIHITGIHSQDTAFEHQGIGLAGTVAYFAIPVNILVRIKTDDMPPFNGNSAHVGDL